MPIPVATRYSASATDLITVKFRCQSCGARHRASVLTTNFGVSVGLPLGVGEDVFASQAEQEAVAGLASEADTLASLARCPSCGRRDGSAVSTAAMLLLPTPLALGALLGAIAGLTYPLMGTDFLTLFSITMALTVALVWAHTTRNRLKEVDVKVEFLPST